MVDILLWNWFLEDSTFILLESNKEQETAIRPLLGIIIVGISKILGMHFWHAHVDVDEEMEDVKEIGGMNTQSETSM